MRILTEYNGDGDFANRSALVVIDNNGDDHGVKYIMDNTVIDYRIFPEHSLYYAEDAAENWVKGIINPRDLLVNDY